MFFTIAHILPIPVDFIGQHPRRRATVSALIVFYLHLQQFAFAVGIKALLFQSYHAIQNTDIEFCSEFYRCLGFSFHDGAQIELPEVDNPIFDAIDGFHTCIFAVRRTFQSPAAAIPVSYCVSRLFLEAFGQYRDHAECIAVVTDSPSKFFDTVSFTTGNG
jgi:hypothetical protein